jgi:hypothetical protein
MLDPLRIQESAASTSAGPSEPWNGEFYANFGDGPTRSWSDAVKFGFISAGGQAWYSGTLNLLRPGDRIWVKVPGSGFVGVGRVTGLSQHASEFKVKTDDGERPVLEVAKGGTYHRECQADSEQSEYFVPVRWLQTVLLGDAVQELGFFGNQNTFASQPVRSGDRPSNN